MRPGIPVKNWSELAYRTLELRVGDPLVPQMKVAREDSHPAATWAVTPIVRSCEGVLFIFLR